MVPTGGDESVRDRMRDVAHELYYSLIQLQAVGKIRGEAYEAEDVFYFACFADAFGVPTPVSYYTVELLPYMAEDFEAWERRMWDKRIL